MLLNTPHNPTGTVLTEAELRGVVSLDTAQAGTFGGQAGWNEYTRGITEFTSGPDEEARKLGMNPEISSPSWDHEAEYIGFYRHCRDLLRNHGQTAIAAE